MRYGTFNTSGSEENNCGQMFKFLFRDCCFIFKKRPTPQRVANGAKSSASSETEGDVASYPNSENEGGVKRTAHSGDSFPTIDEDGHPAPKFMKCHTETIQSSESDDEKQVDSIVPLIAVTNFQVQGDVEEDKIAEAVVFKENIENQDNGVDQLPAYHSRSQLSISTQLAVDESEINVVSNSADEADVENVKVNGYILFGLSYDYQKGFLEVHIKECRNLSPVDTIKNRSDPYVKAYLLPDRSKHGKRKTKVKKNSLNPVFEEILKFPVTVGELDTRTLWLSVWHSNFRRNDFLGEVMLPLAHGTIENYGYKRHPLMEMIGRTVSPLKYNGDIVLALKFIPSYSTQDNEILEENKTGDLHVIVKEGNNLVPAQSNGTSNPFCKSYLLPDKNKTSKQKTPVIKKCCNPKWDHSFIYEDVTLSDLRERCLEITVWSHDKISSNRFLGRVRLNLGKGKYQGSDVEWMDSSGEELNLWNAMLNQPGSLVEGCVLLKTQMKSD